MTDAGGQSTVVVVDEITKVGEARRRAAVLAQQIGFNEVQQGKAALIVTEAGTNLVQHAGGGEIILRIVDFGPTALGMEMLAIDSGCGMSDVSRCLVDGYSSRGTSGTGLGAIRRTADSFDIYSGRGTGTVVWARLLAERPAAKDPTADGEVGAISIAVPGEQLCGDHWSTVTRDGFSFVLVADGLGHGPPAAAASEEAVRVFRGHRSREPAEIIESTHRALRSTRGAALAIARLDFAHGAVRYAGIGNISGVILNTKTGESASMVSQNGTVGYVIRTIQSFDYGWTSDSLLIMHSDGLATHWNMNKYSGLALRHPSLMAGVLYRDHRRKRDDVTVLVARPPSGNRP